LQPRVVKTLAEALVKNLALTSQFGAIAGLARLGPLVVDAVLEPVVFQGDFLAKLEAACELDVGEDDDKKFATKHEATRVLHALRTAAESSSSTRFKDAVGAPGQKRAPVELAFV
jgi:hypothetical protein